MVTAWVSHIQIHPIKSLDATTLRQAGILSSGALEFDRTWAMFDANGKFVNGKRHAAVHRLRSVVDLADRKLSICAGREPMFTDPAFSLDGDREQIGRWLSGYFGFPVELRENCGAGFPDDTASPGPTIISVATLMEIARWFSLPFEQVRRRFRTNIEIDDGLMSEAQKASGQATKKGTVEEALRLMIKLRRQKAADAAFGKYRWRGDLDRSRKGRGVG